MVIKSEPTEICGDGNNRGESNLCFPNQPVTGTKSLITKWSQLMENYRHHRIPWVFAPEEASSA